MESFRRIIIRVQRGLLLLLVINKSENSLEWAIVTASIRVMMSEAKPKLYFFSRVSPSRRQQQRSPRSALAILDSKSYDRKKIRGEGAIQSAISIKVAKMWRRAWAEKINNDKRKLFSLMKLNYNSFHACERLFNFLPFLSMLVKFFLLSHSQITLEMKAQSSLWSLL